MGGKKKDLWQNGSLYVIQVLNLLFKTIPNSFGEFYIKDNTIIVETCEINLNHLRILNPGYLQRPSLNFIFFWLT